MKGDIPIVEVLGEYAGKESNPDVIAAVLCMVEEVKALMRSACTYCKAFGHKVTKCPVHKRLWTELRGDRALNKIRGSISANVRF